MTSTFSEKSFDSPNVTRKPTGKSSHKAPKPIPKKPIVHLHVNESHNLEQSHCPEALDSDKAALHHSIRYSSSDDLDVFQQNKEENISEDVPPALPER